MSYVEGAAGVVAGCTQPPAATRAARTNRRTRVMTGPRIAQVNVPRKGAGDPAKIDSEDAYERAVRMATEISAHALGVERVGVWHLLAGNELELRHLYTASNRRHSTERLRLTLPESSAYGAALHARRAIVANVVSFSALLVVLVFFCG